LQGADQVIHGPVADAGFRVRGDIGSVEGAEGALDGPAAGQEGCVVVLFRVAGDAAGGAQVVFTALDQFLVVGGGSGA
jgi:hypothetical protein